MKKKIEIFGRDTLWKLKEIKEKAWDRNGFILQQLELKSTSDIIQLDIDIIQYRY